MSTQPSPSIKKWLLEILLFSVAGIFHLWSLLRYPAVFVDEAWFGARAWNFITTGQAFSSLDSGVFDRFTGYFTYFPWLPVFLQSLAMRLFPQPEIIAIRLVSWLFGMILLGLVYLIGRRLGGQKLGLLSAAMCAYSWPFLYSAHLGRYDIIVSAFGFAAIAIYLYQPPQKTFWPSLLAGLLALLAFEIHANGMVYAPVLLLLFFSELRGKTLRSHAFWGFISGAGLGGLFYLERHVLHYPETYLAITKIAFAPTHTPPILTFDPQVILHGFADLQIFLWILFWLLPAAVFGLIYLLINAIKGRQDDDVSFCVLVFSLLGFCALLMRIKHSYYGIIVVPALILAAGNYLLKTFKPWPPGKGNPVGYLNRIAWVLVLIAPLHMVLFVKPNSDQLYQPIKERIVQSIRPGDVIMGPQTYWFGLHEHQYYSWETIIYYQRYAQGSTFADVMNEFHPDIFILDGHTNYFINYSENRNDLYSIYLHVPLQDVETFMTSNATRVDAFSTSLFGMIELYRINWDLNVEP